MLSYNTNNHANMLLTQMNYIARTTPHIWLKIKLKILTFKLQQIVTPPDYNIITDIPTHDDYLKSVGTLIKLIQQDLQVIDQEIESRSEYDAKLKGMQLDNIAKLAGWCIHAARVRF